MTTLIKPSEECTTAPNAGCYPPAQKESGGMITGLKKFRLLTPKDLVPRLGTSEAMVRIFLRKYYPEIHVKNKFWNISPELARQIEIDYKNRAKAREAEKKLRIEKELAGEGE
jgi:hypothetical protein